MITGASGTIAGFVARHLADNNHWVFGVSRRPEQAARFTDPRISLLSWEQLSSGFLAAQNFDAVINLAGAPMMCKWTPPNKAEILTSRIQTIRRLHELLQGVPAARRPGCWINASSVAIYSSPPAPVDENAQPGIDLEFFQSRVWSQLEALNTNLQLPRVRNVVLRFGVVIGPHAMLRHMLRLSRWFMGSILGNGKQKISWISHRDLVRAIEFVLFNRNMVGTVNVVSPKFVTAAMLGSSIARSVNRRALLRISEPVLRLALGELAGNFTASAAIQPARLQQAGFNWELADLDEATVVAAHELGFTTSSPGVYGLPVKQSRAISR